MSARLVTFNPTRRRDPDVRGHLVGVEPREGTKMRAILEYVRCAAKGVTSADIIRDTGVKDHSARAMCWYLCERELIERVGEIPYRYRAKS